MKTELRLLSVLLGLVLLASSGCNRGPKSGHGFVFPEGDIAQGRAAFVALDCYQCHTVKDVAGLPDPTLSADKVIVLGGPVAAVKTYGDLVTAIIHPDYEITAQAAGRTAADKDMPVANAEMTVQQMLDIVTFLQPQYTRLMPIYSHYDY
jgi:L-cysteine S-thiosulfotransferase